MRVCVAAPPPPAVSPRMFPLLHRAAGKHPAEVGSVHREYQRSRTRPGRQTLNIKCVSFNTTERGLAQQPESKSHLGLSNRDTEQPYDGIQETHVVT